MNKNNNKKHLPHFLYFVLFFLFFAAKINAQCSNLSMTLTRTNATCVSNGKIQVTLSGSDVSNIRQSDMEFKVDGTLSRSWANYAGNTITNLPAGTYTVSMRAFCNSIGDWVVFNNTATITLTSSYTEMDSYIGVPRKTLNCAPTGMVPVVVKANTGSSPFTIKITNYPASYTGITTFTLTRTYAGNTATQEIEGLPAGDYTFTIADACSYTQTLNATVGKMDQDYAPNIFTSYVYPPHDSYGDCKEVGIYKNYVTRPTDENHYFLYNTYKYYDVGFKINGADPIIWVDPDSLKLSLFNFTLPFTIKEFRANYSTYKLTPYLRVKGSSCTFQLNDIRISYSVGIYIRYDDLECNKATVKFYPQSSSAFCYPYKWRIVKDGTVIQNWSSEVYDGMTQTATNVPYGSKIEFIDHDGYTWESFLNTNPPTPYYYSATTPCEEYGRTADTIHNYLYIYFPNVDVIPIGTKFEFVSGPVTPLHTSVTTTEGISQFYPFSTDYKTWETKFIPPGIYKFNVTLPGVGCTTQSVSVSHTVAYIQTPFSYTTKETCGGLNIIPTGGQLAYKYSDGSSYAINTYYYIYTMSPYVTMDQGPVGVGDTLFFPTSAQYIFGMTYYQYGSCLGDADTINYVKTQFQLNPNVTAAYVCEGAGLGFIRVAGMGGSGNYSYELYDQGVKSATSSTGVFSYGTAGSIYTIRLIDTDPACAASYDQDVQMLDLTSAHILYTSSPTNTYCLDEDSIYLKCISLGETTYTWSGPGVTSTNKNRQNLGIAISDLGVGTYTYSITVKPEGCGNTMNQSITVKVEDCAGARDDYKTLFVNTKDSIDVLANDGFPSTCAGSVVPVIIVSPTKGTATVVNKKVVYTPNTDFIGRDSLTYSTNCSGTITTAKVYLTVIDYPDNIVDADCYIDPPATEWSIKEAWSISDVSFGTEIPYVAGDLDDDGIPEIVAFGSNRSGLRNYSPLHIISGSTKAITTITLPGDGASCDGTGVVGVAKLPNGKALIVVAMSDLYLYAYDKNGTQIWKSDNPYHTHRFVNVGFADFNQDGWPEIHVGRCVFDAETGKLLAKGTEGSSYAAAPIHLSLYSYGTLAMHQMAADVLNRGTLQLIYGNEIHEVNIVSRTDVNKNSIRLSKTAPTPVGLTIYDGHVGIADFDKDGNMDVLISNMEGTTTCFYVWNVTKNTVSTPVKITTTGGGYGAIQKSVPLIGDINGDGALEVVIMNPALNPKANLTAWKYDVATALFSQLWTLGTSDDSNSTGLTLFDFNQDGIGELVYRDITDVRIINGSGKSHITHNDTIPVYDLAKFSASSSTGGEYPLVLDVDGDGQAEIVVSANSRIRVFKTASEPWAPARKVWNQYSYNAVNVNEDLTIPKVQVSSATVFPGKDGVLGTTDDIRPFNNFLQQQTTLGQNGNPIWPTPDAYSNSSMVTTSVSGNSVTINVGIANKGDASIGSPVYVTLYKNVISAANKIMTGSANIQINPGGTGVVSLTIADITLVNPTSIIIRINDDGTKFPYQPECDDTNNIIAILNPAINLMMQKNATLEGVPHNGTYENPVAALYSEIIEYTITAVNANIGVGKVIIRDTLPPYLDFVSSNPVIIPTASGTTPQRAALEWVIAGVPSSTATVVTVKATPQEGSSASQPMFINRAWVTVSDTITVPTNSTFHQGASIGIATFSAGFGGNIYNAGEQALDYRTSPRSGIVIVPDEGYRFAGWSYEEYVSLRGKTIQAEEGIMYYDTLTVYGDIELKANFELEEFPIEYHLNGAVNAGDNPPIYTIESGSITLGAPEKAEDIFTGWTGSNGETPQQTVIIPKGSSGELEFYANFLRSGREDEAQLRNPEEDKIWAAKDELYIRTSKPGSVVRIYSTEGVLQKQQTILQPGETKMKLSRGIYVVTLNNSIGKKIIIE